MPASGSAVKRMAVGRSGAETRTSNATVAVPATSA